MLRKLKENASLAALVLAAIALFVAIGGVAGALPGKNSVDSADIKKNSVKSSDIKNDGVTGTDVKESTLKLAASGLPGVNFQNAGSIQYGKDGFGIVHLRGQANSVTLGTSIATLPAGFRPSAAELQPAVGGFSSPCAVQIGTDGTVTPEGTASCNTLFLSVSGVTFAAG